MNTFSYVQMSGYMISLSHDKESDMWCASIYQLEAMGQGKTKAEAIKDLGFALVDLMDSYIKDNVELPIDVLSTTTTMEEG